MLCSRCDNRCFDVFHIKHSAAHADVCLVGFFSVGPAPLTNLLLMEKSRREDWLKTYNWTSLISAVGPVVAMLAGYVWLMEYSA